jgi:hypothetical protein
VLISSYDDGDSGKAYIWTKNDDGSWEEYAGNLNIDSGAGGYYGHACTLSADGKTALITGHNGVDSGCAYIWTKQADDRWEKYTGNLNMTSGTGGRYGFACDLSADGQTALITGHNTNDSGCAYIWTNEGGDWVQYYGNLNIDSGAGGNYGSACSLSADGKTALVSGQKDSNSGFAYIWTKNEITREWLVSVPSLNKNTVNTPGLYGRACALSDDGKTALIAGFIWDNQGCAFVWYGNVHDDPPTTSTEEQWDVSERQRAYSSYASDFRFSTLASNTCWRDANATAGGWIQMDLGQPYNVYGIVIAGNANVETNEWVTNVDIETSTDGTTWATHVTNLVTNTDATEKTARFNAIQTQHVRIVVKAFNTHPSMRVALLASQTTAIELVRVNYNEDTSASFKTEPPDELETITNLTNNEPMTIHNYSNILSDVEYINTTEVSMNNKKALNMNLTGLSYVLDVPNNVYDTHVFGITTLCVFRKESDQYNHNWVILSGHGPGKSYFSVRRQGNLNFIGIQFGMNSSVYANQDEELIPFNFSNPDSNSNFLVYGSVKAIGDNTLEFILELHQFGTNDTDVSVVKRQFTKETNLAGFSYKDYVIGMDQLTNQLDHYGSITLAEARHYKGNFTTTDKDKLIQSIITYWTT